MLKKLDFITPTLLKVLYLFHEDPLQEMHEREGGERALFVDLMFAESLLHPVWGNCEFAFLEQVCVLRY